MPEAADPDEHASLRHLGRDRVVVLEGIGGVVGQVGSRAQAGGSVLLGEVGDGPHRVADDGWVWLRQGDDLIVGVDQLGRLVGSDGDGGQRRDEETGIEDLLDDGQDVRMDGDPLVERSVDEEVVDPGGAEALEEVVGGDDPEGVFESEQVLVQLVDQVRGDGVLDHRPAVGPHPLGVGLDGGVVEGPGVGGGAD